jgi:hypothetical protein
MGRAHNQPGRERLEKKTCENSLMGRAQSSEGVRRGVCSDQVGV